MLQSSWLVWRDESLFSTNRPDPTVWERWGDFEGLKNGASLPVGCHSGEFLAPSQEWQGMLSYVSSCQSKQSEVPVDPRRVVEWGAIDKIIPWYRQRYLKSVLLLIPCSPARFTFVFLFCHRCGCVSGSSEHASSRWSRVNHPGMRIPPTTFLCRFREGLHNGSHFDGFRAMDSEDGGSVSATFLSRPWLALYQVTFSKGPIPSVVQCI